MAGMTVLHVPVLGSWRQVLLRAVGMFFEPARVGTPAVGARFVDR